MLIFVNQGLIVYSIPKTGSTSIEKAIGKGASIKLSGTGDNGLKHINSRKFNKWSRTLRREFPNQQFVSCCVIREPLDRLKSWYRYKSRDTLKNQKRYVGNLTFEEYLNNLCDKIEKKSTRYYLNSLSRFLIFRDKINVDRIFPYEKIEEFTDFLSLKLNKEIKLPRKNVSPQISSSKLQVSEETLNRLNPFISLDVNLYNKILEIGSYDSSIKEHNKSVREILNKAGFR